MFVWFVENASLHYVIRNRPPFYGCVVVESRGAPVSYDRYNVPTMCDYYTIWTKIHGRNF